MDPSLSSPPPPTGYGIQHGKFSLPPSPSQTVPGFLSAPRPSPSRAIPPPPPPPLRAAFDHPPSPVRRLPSAVPTLPGARCQTAHDHSSDLSTNFNDRETRRVHLQGTSLAYSRSRVLIQRGTWRRLMIPVEIPRPFGAWLAQPNWRLVRASANNGSTAPERSGRS